VIVRPQLPLAEPGRELVGVDQIPFVAAPLLAMTIADDEPVHQREEEIVEPLGLGPFLEGDVDGASHPAKELGQSRGLGGQNGPGEPIPARRLSMRQFVELLRLHAEGLRVRQLAESLGLPRSTVADYLTRAADAGVGWPLPEGTDEATLLRCVSMCFVAGHGGSG